MVYPRVEDHIIIGEPKNVLNYKCEKAWKLTNINCISKNYDKLRDRNFRCSLPSEGSSFTEINIQAHCS